MFDALPDLAQPHALLQDPAFAAALRLCGQMPRMLPCGLTLLRQHLWGIPLAMLPRAIPPPDLNVQIKATGLRRCVLILSPDAPTTMHGAVRLRAGMSLARLDLNQPHEQRHKSLHPKWRNQLKRAKQAGLRIVHSALPADPMHPLLSAEAEMARSRRYATWPASLTAAFAKSAPNQTRLFTAFKGNTPIAQMLFLRHGTSATYHIGKTTQAGRSANAHNLLLWNASCWLADQGHTQLELGTLAPQTPDLNRFKLRTGATPHLTGGTWLRLVL